MRLCVTAVSFIHNRVFCQAYRHSGEHNRIDQSGHTHTDSPPSNTEPVTLGSQVAGEDLRRHQECNSTPGRSITERTQQVSIEAQLKLGVIDLPNIKQEQHGNSSRGKLRSFVRILLCALVYGSSLAYN